MLVQEGMITGGKVPEKVQRHGIPGRGGGSVQSGAGVERAAECQGRNMQIRTGKLEKSHRIA